MHNTKQTLELWLLANEMMGAQPGRLDALKVENRLDRVLTW